MEGPILLLTTIISTATDLAPVAPVTDVKSGWFNNVSGIIALATSLALVVKTVIDAIKNRGEGLSNAKKTNGDLYTMVLQQNSILAETADKLRAERNLYWEALAELRNRVISHLPEDFSDEILKDLYVPNHKNTNDPQNKG